MNIPLDKSTDTTPLRYNDKCDKYDYLTAVGCGAIAGIVDIFLVGSPKDSALTSWTDSQVDNCVKGFAKKCGWNSSSNNNIASAIGFLEKKFKVNYDQRNSTDVGNLFSMGTKNHHFKSLAHSPDILGLFFSVLNQFTSTSTFISDGQLITIVTDTFELNGSNFVSKIFCGIANWFGHIMSDIAGSSGGRGAANSGRGSGVALPFFELFGFCNFGKFSIGKDKQDLATLATRVFQEGYDLRFGITMAIPVLICDLLIRLIWSIRRFFQYKKPLKDCIPNYRHDDLRVMLLLGNGVLCVIDVAEAGISSGGNWLVFFSHLNIIAWFKLAMLAFKELCIRTGISLPIQNQIDFYKRMNAALTDYLQKLESIDIELFRRETEEYNNIVYLLEKADDEYSLNNVLNEIYDKMDIEKPYTGDFDEFMSNKNNRLVFG